MKVSQVELLHCDGGWRVFSFCKITTDEGLVGYSEFNETYGSYGVSAAIERLAPRVVGQDPRANERIYWELYSVTRQSPSGVITQAIAAIENAIMDLKGKALGVPVYELLGGPIRDRFRLYWSHCGTTRIMAPQHAGVTPLKSLDDVSALGREVKEKGFSGLKTNILLFDNGPQVFMPGFGWSQVFCPELNADRRVIEGLRDHIAAFREGAGPEMDILLDLNFNFKTEGYLKVTRALDDLGLFWFEIDSFDPRALAQIHRATKTPLASCESLFGLREYRPYFENYATDVAIIDVPWNGIVQSMKIAAMAEAYEINVAPHNFYGHLATFMSAHFCASIPNFRIMEIDIDDVPWKDDLVTQVPEVQDGHLVLPTGPGWGTEVDEDAVMAHPAQH